MTPLFVSSWKGHADVVRLCLERGAAIDRMCSGESSLHIAVKNGHADVVRLCLDRGASVNLRCTSHGSGATPLWYACRRGNAVVARLCLDRGADVDLAVISVPNGEPAGSTPLWAACWNAHLEVARLCLERGADINRTDSAGRTPYAIAHIEGHAVMTAWLKRVRAVGWARHLSEPRYKLVVLKELVARARARRERAFHGKEHVLDLLFPGGRPNTRRDQPRLPDDVFTVVARFYFGGGLWAEEEAAAAAESAASVSDDY